MTKFLQLGVFIKIFNYNICIYEESHNRLHLGTVSNNIMIEEE